MKIFILQKSITNLKNPIKKSEYNTEAKTIKEFIVEMVSNNYQNYKKGILSEHIDYALNEFMDGSYYIINQTRNIKYISLDDMMNISEGDEIMLIKLKYNRGFIWLI